MKYLMVISLMLFSTVAYAAPIDSFLPPGAVVEWTSDAKDPEVKSYNWACFRFSGQRYMMAYDKTETGLTAVNKCPDKPFKPKQLLPVPMD